MLLLFTVVVLVIAVALALVALKPGELHVERSAVIGAPPKVVFQLINDLRAWEAWTPYDSDPLVRETYSDPAIGSGATYTWSGNREAGEGSLTVTRSVPYSRVCLDLDMVRPFRGHNKIVFNLHPDMDGTRVSWALSDKTSFAGRVRGLFVNLDRRIGGDLEVGLARLKDVAENTGRVSLLRIVFPDSFVASR